MTVRRKKPLTKEQTAFDTDVRINTLEKLVEATFAQIEELRVIISGQEAVLRSADAPPTMADLIATEDSLIGHWMAQQVSEGKTTVDLAMVEHIRTGIRLALSA